MHRRFPPAHLRRPARTAISVTATLAILLLMPSPAPAQPDGPDAPPAGCAYNGQPDEDRDSCLKQLVKEVADGSLCAEWQPADPRNGVAGFFGDPPSGPTARQEDPGKATPVAGRYSDYGYASLNFVIYRPCSNTPTTSQEAWRDQFFTDAANVEFMLATGIIATNNAIREKAWNPQGLWGWADEFLGRLDKKVYSNVFTPFGGLTLALLGVYLLWRSRYADMSQTLTIVGWAVFVLVTVTAVTQWPAASAHLADRSLVQSIDMINHSVTIGADNPSNRTDTRAPAVHTADDITTEILYQNWLRGTLGSADSATAHKYGPMLYDAKSFTWTEITSCPKDRKQAGCLQELSTKKQREWNWAAAQVQQEDPSAYAYLTGSRGIDRIGVGFVTLLSAISFSLFDLTAWVMVLLGFLIIRWAIIALPALGPIALSRHHAGTFKRLGNAVASSLINVVLFATAGQIYLSACDTILSTSTIPGWLQVLLIVLTASLGWQLLRPYRRLDALGGLNPVETGHNIGNKIAKRWSTMRARRKSNKNQKPDPSDGDDDDNPENPGPEGGPPDTGPRPEGKPEPPGPRPKPRPGPGPKPRPVQEPGDDRPPTPPIPSPTPARMKRHQPTEAGRQQRKPGPGEDGQRERRHGRHQRQTSTKTILELTVHTKTEVALTQPSGSKTVTVWRPGTGHQQIAIDSTSAHNRTDTPR
jgi:hypothetical protein